VLGPAVGRAIDTRGGRGMLALSNLVLAAGLALLAIVDGLAGLVAAWAVLGIGMAMGLYSRPSPSTAAQNRKPPVRTFRSRDAKV
jgi:MFS family permease